LNGAVRLPGRRVRAATRVVAALLATGCGALPTGPAGDTRDPPDHSPDAPRILKLQAVPSPANALAAFVTWETDVPVPTRLDVDCEGEYTPSFTSDESFTDHEVFLMGLWEGADCTLAVTADDGSAVVTATLALQDAGPLPELLPVLFLNVLDEARVAPGWTAWSLSDPDEGGPLRLFLVDARGRYRWYHFGDDSVKAGAGAELQQVEGGLLQAAGGPDMILGWDGKPLWEAPFSSHHDLQLSPWDPDRLFYLGVSSKNCATPEHTVVEFDRALSEQVWEWRICEHYIPPDPYDGWSHVNTVAFFPDEAGKLLLSVRNQDVLLRVDRDSGDIDWVLGWDGDFEMAPEDLFLRQHAPEFLENGEILLFDNGLEQDEADRKGDDPAKVRPVSRVIQLALTFHGDGSPDAARVTWEYLDPALFAFARSEADRLPNGNTLITYSQLAPGNDSMLREVTLERDVVWELRTPPQWSTYRAERMTPVSGEVRSRP